jgi:hypothetical protein
MIPIRDLNRSQTYPVVNHILIAVNVLVFLIQLTQGTRLDEFIFRYGLVPARYSRPEIAAYFTITQQVIPFVSFMFLHGGFLHLIGNMWFIYIFGDNVEDRLGHLRYLAFYLLCGLASGLSHLVLNWTTPIPTIGASGAIAGVMGAYLILFPRAKVLTLIPIFFLPYFVEVPAFVFLGIWLLFQFVSAAGTPPQVGGVAWWAHIGGFVFGVVFLKLFQWLPELGADRMMRTVTKKRGTPRLQVIHPVEMGTDSGLHGVITVSGREAREGARKLVSIMAGPTRRTFFVTIPAGVGEGTTLRLRELGGTKAADERGDLYLKVHIRG